MLLLDSVMIALLTAFTVLFISRFEIRKGTSIRQYVIMRAPALLSKMFSCDFCLCFWLSLLLSAACVPLLGEQSLLIPFLATPISRFVL